MTSTEAQQKFLQKTHTHQPDSLAMYSSWLGGIVKDPTLMLIPIDDHLVHRGDGVFEAIKCVEGHLYLLPQHLDRLYNSAQKIFLEIPYSRETLQEIIRQTVAAAGVRTAMVRLYVSRGPGTFGTNPYDSIGAQVYIVVTKFKELAPQKYAQGVRVGRSQIPPKEKWLAQIKTCNYLPNVLMKKEAVDKGYDFMIGFDELGNITESSTENIVILTRQKVLVHPPLEQILSGTTMRRAFELSSQLDPQLVESTAVRSVSLQDLLDAREVMMMGTTLDVLPVVEFAGHPIADGQVGPVAKALRGLMQSDLQLNFV